MPRFKLRSCRLLAWILALGSLVPTVHSYIIISAYDAVPAQVLVSLGTFPSPENASAIQHAEWVGVSNETDVYVLDTGRKNVIRFSSHSNALEMKTLIVDDQLKAPRSLRVHPDGRIAVLEANPAVIRFFDRNGGGLSTVPLGNVSADFMSFDSMGRIYAGARGHSFLRRYLAEGRPDPAWQGVAGPGTVSSCPAIDIAVNNDQLMLLCEDGGTLSIGMAGEILSRGRVPRRGGHIAPYKSGGYLVSDEGTGRLWILDSTGKTVGRFVSPDGNETAFQLARGITLGSDGLIYVANQTGVSAYLSRWQTKARQFID